jgi:hypothetical protein
MDYGSFDEFQEIADLGYTGHLDNLNITQIYEFMMHDCESFFVECRWRKKKMKCCEIFKMQLTEYGICWSFNSLTSVDKMNLNDSKMFPWRVHSHGRRSALEVKLIFSSH